jgi:hypothetical protein
MVLMANLSISLKPIVAVLEGERRGNQERIEAALQDSGIVKRVGKGYEGGREGKKRHDPQGEVGNVSEGLCHEFQWGSCQLNRRVSGTTGYIVLPGETPANTSPQ